MKKIILMMMCLAIAMTSYSNDNDELEVSGMFLSKSNVKFEVSIVNNDNSTVVVQTKSNVFAYRIKLKLGKDYIVKFIKDEIVKELYISADQPGYMQVDIDFKTTIAAQLCYSDKIDEYNLILLYRTDE